MALRWWIIWATLGGLVLAGVMWRDLLSLPRGMSVPPLLNPHLTSYQFDGVEMPTLQLLQRQLPSDAVIAVRFDAALDDLSKYTGARFQVSWYAVARHGLRNSAPVDAPKPGMTLSQALSQILDSLGPQFRVKIEGDTFLIVTADDPSVVQTRSYRLGVLLPPLLVPPPDPRVEAIRDELRREVPLSVDPDGKRFSFASGALTARDLPANHARIQLAIKWMQWRADAWRFATRAAACVAVSLLTCLSIRALLQWRARTIASRVGLCTACGYDLRATPARCPECGTIPNRRDDA